MPDQSFSGGQSWLPASHLLGEVEQPTDAKSLMAPFTGNPQQMLEFLMHPGNQEHMAQFGVHFNPQTIQQSPFFSNHFMQGHPQLGQRLSGAMANMAATPEAPMVSGAGSGISRAMQGMMGGPELQRQYQMRQLMAPMQQMGAQIPSMEFGRKQELLQGLLGSMKSTEDTRAEGLRQQGERDAQQAQFKQDQLKQQGELANQRISATRPTAPGYVYKGAGTQQGPPQPTQTQSTMPQGLGMPAPQGPPSLSQTPGGWEKDPGYQHFSPVQQGLVAPGGMRGKPTPKNFEDLETQKAHMYESLEKEYAPYWNPTPPTGSNAKDWAATQKEKRQELEGRKQSIENYYSEGRNQLGAPVPTFGYPGQNVQQPSSMMAPGGGQQGPQQRQQFPPDAMVDEEGNIWDSSGQQFLGKQ